MQTAIRLIRSLAVAGLLLAGCIGAVQADAEARRILAPTGKLKAGLYPGTPTSILSGTELRGVGYELGKLLAERLGVPYEPVVFSKNAEVLEAVKTGAVDVVFTNATPARAKDMDFAQPYMDIELGYLVPKDSKLVTVPDVDSRGIRIGVTEKSTSDATLSRDLKAAEVVRAPTVIIAIDYLAAGKIDAFATNKATLFEMSEKLPGSKVLDGRWGAERHAIGIPKGRDAGLAFVRQFTETAKADGIVKSAMSRAGLRGAVVAESR